MELTIKNLSAHYVGASVLTDISLRVETGSLLTLVGPSGSGKSTLLRAIAGLVPPHVSGDILFDGRSVISDAPKARNIGFVFQDLALYPHLRVRDNLSLALRFSNRVRRSPTAAEIAERVKRVATRLEIDEYLERYPRELSGGQQQRAAIARAIVRAPDLNVLLLDEPFTGLDPLLRATTRDLIRSLHEEIGITTVCVTHDRIDALTIADRIAILKDGELVQIDTPNNILDRPANTFVASFVGETPLNYYPAELIVGNGLRLRFAGIDVLLPPGGERFKLEGVTTVGIRPEAISLADDCRARPEAHLHAVTLPVRKRELLGERVIVEATTPDNSSLRFVSSRRVPEQACATLCIAISDIYAFDSAQRLLELPS